nr:CBS domain-containing protein [Candidatus Sigynarchaeum springense]MDO8118686.1 CBS domain-containing protein [Candidatus Sigynarchaeota archaeon]
MKKKVLEFARTDLITKPMTASIQDIAKIMKEGIIGSVFLTGKGGKIEGFIADRAIFALIAEGKNPLLAKPADLMEKIVTVPQDTPALEVLELMNQKSIMRVGITNEEGTLIGIVSKKKLQFEQQRILRDELGIED